MWNLIFGIGMIIGGLSGKLVLIGTNSGMALVAVGGVLLVIGIAQIASARGGGE